MTSTLYAHLAFTPEHRPYVEGVGVKVELIATVYTAAGLSAEEIVATYPPLTLGQVYSALAYYYDHQTEMDPRIAEGDRLVEEVAVELDSGPELQARLQSRGRPP